MNGLHPITYHEQSANLTLDYRYILEKFFEFGIEVLGFNKRNFRVICKQFEPAFSNYKAYNKQNFFNITIFNLHRNTLNMKDYFEKYFNYISVYNKSSDEEYLYLGVAINEGRILDVLEKGLAYKLLDLLSHKEKYFEFKAFGRAIEKDSKQFFIVNF